MKIYSLLDRKLREYGALAVANNDEAVKRSVKDGLTGTKSTVEKYPEDFDLYCLGAMDMESGVITPEPVPRLVENVSAILLPVEVAK